MIRLVLDLMGGDRPPQELLGAALDVQQECASSCSLSAVVEKSLLPSLQEEGRGIDFIPAEEWIGMDESPLLAVRRKRHSSMAVGIRLIKEGKADAFVSTGNTGALVATAQLLLPKLPTIERPAFLVVLPTEKGRVAVIDVGANVSFTVGHLIDYARLGVLYCQAAEGISHPRVGLLNIGEEDEKGTQLMKGAFSALKEAFADQEGAFLGNVEGREVFHGKVDVLVTDAFTGNVFLKTCEGASTFLMEYLEEYFTTKAFPILKHLHKLFNYAEHPGALLCGLEGIVVKCHGYSNRRALANGLRGARDLVNKDLIAKLRDRLA